MNSWTTWWARAQRGVGLMPQACPSKMELIFHDVPACSSFRWRFGTAYDTQPVTIKNVFCFSENSSERTPITFQGKRACQIPPQKTIVSDEAAVQGSTIHLAYEIETKEGYACTSGFGWEAYDNITSDHAIIYLLRSLELQGSSIKGSVAAFGDSITEQGHWTVPLSAVLKKKGYALLQLGISGNRLLRHLEHVKIKREYHEDIHLEHKVYTQIPLGKQCFGKAGIQRFQEEITSCLNVQGLILGIGVNDLYQPGTFCAELQEFPSVEDMACGYQQLQDLFPEERILALGITPFLGAEASSIGKEKIRQDVNAWLSHHMQHYISFDDLLANGYDQIKSEYHNGDFLHPNQKAGLHMAEKIMQELEVILCG